MWLSPLDEIDGVRWNNVKSWTLNTSIIVLSDWQLHLINLSVRFFFPSILTFIASWQTSRHEAHVQGGCNYTQTLCFKIATLIPIVDRSKVWLSWLDEIDGVRWNKVKSWTLNTSIIVFSDWQLTIPNHPIHHLRWSAGATSDIKIILEPASRHPATAIVLHYETGGIWLRYLNKTWLLI